MSRGDQFHSASMPKILPGGTNSMECGSAELEVADSVMKFRVFCAAITEFNTNTT